jgi:hypothetical protein
MGILDTILSANNGAVVSQISKQLGIPDSVAQQAVSSLVPALSRGLVRNAEKPGGLDSLLGALGSGKHAQYLDNPQTIGKASSIDDGKAILGHIFGSKDVSRNVAGNAAQKTGIDAGILKQMLPMLGTVAMGALAKQTGAGQVQGIGGLGALAGFLDQDGDGDATDDVLNLAKKYF